MLSNFFFRRWRSPTEYPAMLQDAEDVELLMSALRSYRAGRRARPHRPCTLSKPANLEAMPLDSQSYRVLPNQIRNPLQHQHSALQPCSEVLLRVARCGLLASRCCSGRDLCCGSCVPGPEVSAFPLNPAFLLSRSIGALSNGTHPNGFLRVQTGIVFNRHSMSTLFA